MSYGTDTNIPTVYHQRLLADKSFDFTPFWEESIVNWLHRNAARLLRVNQHCCKFFIGDEGQKGTLSTELPLENDEDIVMYLRTLGEGDSTSFTNISDRLIKAGKADLAVSSKLYAFQKMETPDRLLSTVSDKSISRILDTLAYEATFWNIGSWSILLKRAPVDRLKDIPVSKIPCRTRWDGAEKCYVDVKLVRYQVASNLAKMLPVADLHAFISSMSEASMMDCFNCGDFRAKSKPGYTLHRKVCDKNNLHPNALVAAAERLLQ